MTHAITVVLKPGYAPIEQYGDVATMAQGAWTDLYALACVVYYAIAGKTPTSSVERLMDDRVEPLAVAAAGRYSDAFLRAIDAALAVRPGDRPQTEREFRALLDAGLPAQPADDARDSGHGAVRDGPRHAGAAAGGRTAAWFAPPTRRPSGDGAGRAADAVDRAVGVERAVAERAPTSIGAVEPSGVDGADREPPSPATVGASRNPAATLLIGVAVVAVIATVALFAWLQQRGPAPVDASAAASAIATPARRRSLRRRRRPRATRRPAPSPSRASAQRRRDRPSPTRRRSRRRPRVPGPPSSSEHRSTAPPAVEAKIDRPPDAAPLPPTARSGRARDGRWRALLQASRPRRRDRARPRRESPAPARADNAAVPKPAAPRAPTVSARCSDILQKASLEPLTATEAAYLKRECR